MNKEWTGERMNTNIHSQVTVEHLHRYALAMEYVEGKDVLDIACGEGYGSRLLAQKAKSVTGVDIDDNSIRQANKKYGGENLSFLQGAVEAIPLAGNSVDVIISFETLEHTTEHEKFLSEAKRVLKAGGLLIISTPDKKWYSDKPGYQNPFHKKELYEQEFEKLLKKHFTGVKIVFQKFLSASVVFSQSGHDSQFYEGNFDEVSRQQSNQAPYMIALASDGSLPIISQSFFNAGDVLGQAVLAKERDIKNSFSYKLGHVLLRPAKWVKKFLKKS